MHFGLSVPAALFSLSSLLGSSTAAPTELVPTADTQYAFHNLR